MSNVNIYFLKKNKYLDQKMLYAYPWYAIANENQILRDCLLLYEIHF